MQINSFSVGKTWFIYLILRQVVYVLDIQNQKYTLNLFQMHGLQSAL